MCSVRTSEKPTLGHILTGSQDESVDRSSRQKIFFPKINTNLKKNQFTKYRSALINSKSFNSNLERQFVLNKNNKNINNQLNPQLHQNHNKSDKKIKSSLYRKNWKINKTHDESYTIRSIEKLDASSNRSQSDADSISKRKQTFLNYPEIESPSGKKKEKLILLTQIKQNSNSPTHRANEFEPQKQVVRNPQYINAEIEHSNKIISLIQKNYKKGFFQQKGPIQSLQQKLGLFAYLKRNFVTRKRTLTPQKVAQYLKSPSNKNLQAKINFQSRSFLKQKLHTDYRSYKEVQRLKKDIAKQAIQQQIIEKKAQYQQEYNKKYHAPYLSFLSLPKYLKMKVLENLTSQNLKNNKR